MSIGAIPFQSSTSFDYEFNALMAQQSALSQNNSIFGAQGYPDPLASNSIFGGGGNNFDFGGGQSPTGLSGISSNGMPTLNLAAFSSLSNAQEEQFVANSSAAAINDIIGMQLPTIPIAQTDTKA